MLLKIASRKSDLARLQALVVARKLKEADSSVEVEHLFSASFGDLNPDISLDKMPTKGAFTEDFKEGIKNREFDLVVHSWKDLPTDLPDTSRLFTIDREDPRDILLLRKDAIGKKDLTILTSSPRRIHHIIPFVNEYFPYELSSAQCKEVRGNIPTRLRKLIEKEGDALIMAKAALDRLLSIDIEEFDEVKKELRGYLEECQFMILPLSHFPTAAAQGALAIEVNVENKEAISVLEKIHSSETARNVNRERELLQSYGGGCHQKLGMTSVSHAHGDYFSVSGLTPDGSAVKSIDLINDNEIVKADEAELFKSAGFFDRQRLDQKIPSTDLYIARDYALPEEFKQKDEVIFTSGMNSWKKLAKRGYWVTGSSESLGEGYGKNLESLLGRELNWTKLSHADAPGDKLATYKLTPSKELPNLEGKKHFYWMSGSQFALALSENPKISEAFHACGPGNTHSAISKSIPSERLEIYLSYEQWYQNKTR